MLLTGAVSAFGLSTEWILPVIKLLGRLLGVALAMVVIFRGKYSHLVQRLAIGFSAIVVLSPVIHPGTCCGCCRSSRPPGSGMTGRCCGCT
ncbi:hypothetical protein [Arthrobacter sp. JCM 19049]|uniref:hypothetical protein n=1 Tax=Arthrobacter sp. JCM 19049 TaxID=1460643 RepID=UPI000B1238C8|nr:hypothetical protein [Arthrobacter sp. JCM 19049]